MTSRLVTVALLGAALAAACSSNVVTRHRVGDAGAARPPVTDAGAGGRSSPGAADATTDLDASPPTDAPAEAGIRDAAPPSADGSADGGPIGTLPGDPWTAHLRFANFLDDDGAVQICLRRHGDGAETDWSPLLGSASLRGLTEGLPALRVTAYVELAPVAWDVRVVAQAGGGACTTTPLVEGELPSVDGGSRGTVLFAGAGSDVELRLVQDASEQDPFTARLRIVHSAPGTRAVDAQLASCQRLAKGLTAEAVIPAAYPQTDEDYGCYSSIDALGYVTESANPFALSSAPIVDLLDATSGSVLEELRIPPALSPFEVGAVHSLYVHRDRSNPSGLGVTACRDAPSLDALSSCAETTRTNDGLALLRFLEAAPGGTFDLCVKTGSIPWQSQHKVLTGLHFLSEASLLMPELARPLLRMVPEGEACDADTPFQASTEFYPDRSVQIVAVPGVELEPDSGYYASASLIALDVFSGTYPTQNDIESYLVEMAQPPNGRQYSFGVYDSSASIIGMRGPTPLYLDGTTLLSVFYATMGDSRPIAVRRALVTVPPSPLRSFVFVANGGYDPTDLVVCDLTVPPLDVAATPCARYPMDPVP